jgi:hypothetical protein
VRLDGIAGANRKIAASILLSGLAQQGNPLPPDGFAVFIGAIRARGFSDRDLDLMATENPGRRLGLR